MVLGRGRPEPSSVHHNGAVGVTVVSDSKLQYSTGVTPWMAGTLNKHPCTKLAPEIPDRGTPC